jgi:uncharacterized protein (DUF1778 family)
MKRLSKFERSYRLLGIAQYRAIFKQRLNRFGLGTVYIKQSSAGPEEPWIKLGQVGSSAFAEALLNPPEPNDAAKEAAAGYVEWSAGKCRVCAKPF